MESIQTHLHIQGSGLCGMVQRVMLACPGAGPAGAASLCSALSQPSSEAICCPATGLRLPTFLAAALTALSRTVSMPDRARCLGCRLEEFGAGLQGLPEHAPRQPLFPGVAG